MLWIKRNLFLAIGGLLALALLGGGVFYYLGAKSRNAELITEVESTRSKLNNHYASDPFPHQTNIAAAKAESAKLQAAVAKAHKYFTPVPVEKVNTRDFLRLRNTTLDELRTRAAQANVALPKDRQYAFSFETQRSRNEFGPGTFPAVPEQMMEIKALCQILFDSRVSQITGIRRARVSEDDRKSSNAGDYLERTLDNVMVTSAQAESHHYELSFLCFSEELAAVVNGLERSPHGFITKALMVEPKDPRMADAGGAVTAAAAVAAANPRFNPRERLNPRADRPVQPAGARPPVPALVQLLQQRQLAVTLLVYSVKPAPNSSRN